MRVAPEAQEAAGEIIRQRWGDDYVPDEPPVFETKSKLAQEAHEAIRPTNPHLTPESARACLNEQQAKLYTLIWQRFIASQIQPALYDVTRIFISATMGSRNDPLPHLFRAASSERVFDGFFVVSGGDDEDKDDGKMQSRLPHLVVGPGLSLQDMTCAQQWSKPPSRYSGPH